VTLNFHDPGEWAGLAGGLLLRKKIKNGASGKLDIGWRMLAGPLKLPGDCLCQFGALDTLFQ
jgi:hypothetical protein